ncbi:MAG: SDR family oxidoreductase [Balneola sp.]|nr:SDR family oxidoreductase [Balneola sp.]MBO6652300.1 SDR family oxidoreductase [Balneola sp.]MBO6711458.1 SDR family oxidoreductase [Balneola sp.]MBO6801188.1 SDR family oxidoreductase [Balneola sp.]MBO6869394.1 SDR family oxidoreductase [Balneola sp.]
MKTIVITGASKGIGFETALSLLEQDINVVAIARSTDQLKQLKSEASSPNLTLITADVTNAEDLKKIIAEIEDIGMVDGLINNAGMVLNKPFSETTSKEWKAVFDVNFFAPVHLIKLMKPFFRKDSHIVNISSMGGFQGSDKFSGLSAYSTAKGALAILSECLSTEFSSSRIAVNCLCLGAVQTKMLEKAFPGYQAPVQPNEMGSFISDFVLNAHRFMNGKVIPVSLNNPE